MSSICLIPARNEESRIVPVIEAALSCKDIIDEVWVIDNGSTDDTAAVSRDAGAKVMSYPEPGKGGAVAYAMKALTEPNDVVLLLDADLRGLQPAHIASMVHPVISGKYVQAAGVRDGHWLRKMYYRYHIGLAGERCFRAYLLWEIHELDYQGWALEVALNSICRWSPKRRKREIAKIFLSGVSDVPKHEKLDVYQTHEAARAAKLRVAREFVLGFVRFNLHIKLKHWLT